MRSLTPERLDRTVCAVNEILWIGLLAVNFFFILAVYRIWGVDGLFLWIPIAVIAANVQVVKTIEVFGLTATLGNIVYAGSFLVTDILSENHGRHAARRAVMLGFTAVIAITVLMNIALLFRPAPSDTAHDSLVAIFSLFPRIAIASIVAYIVSQYHDVWVYAFLKKRLPARRFIWLRNNASTMVSQLIDTAIFTTIAFFGYFDEARVFWEVFLTTYVLKWLVAACDTPFVYLARSWRDAGRIPSGGTFSVQAEEDARETPRERTKHQIIGD